MFDFIKNIFKKTPQEEQIVEVEVKAKRKYKPRAPKTEVKEEAVVEVVEPVVITEAPAEPVRPRIMARQLVGASTPVVQPTEVVAEPVIEPVVEAVVAKAPAKKKPAAKKPVAPKVEKPVAEPVIEVAAPVVEPEVKVEPVVEKSVPKKPDNKPKPVQNKPPRGKKKKR